MAFAPEFRAHHVAISVRDPDKTVAFYARLGFTPVREWRAEDGSLTITHLGLGGFLLEVFAYASNALVPAAEPSPGNDLEAAGVKHLALAVGSLAAVRADLVGSGLVCTEIVEGRTGLIYCFVRDPDGYWVELVESETPHSRHQAVDV